MLVCDRQVTILYLLVFSVKQRLLVVKILPDMKIKFLNIIKETMYARKLGCVFKKENYTRYEGHVFVKEK